MAKQTRSIDVIVHFPESEEAQQIIQDGINKCYIQMVKKQLCNSNLYINDKKQVVNHILKHIS